MLLLMCLYELILLYKCSTVKSVSHTYVYSLYLAQSYMGEWGWWGSGGGWVGVGVGWGEGGGGGGGGGGGRCFFYSLHKYIKSYLLAMKTNGNLKISYPIYFKYTFNAWLCK